MCSEFSARYDVKALEEALSKVITNASAHTEWNQRVRLTNSAPTLRMENEKLTLQEFVFPARPFPNARLSSLEEAKSDPHAGPKKSHEEISRIYDKRSWKEGFIEGRCLVPMSSFLEPVYWGEEIGSVMEFSPPKEDLFFVPAIRISAFTPKTKDAFSLLTHTATEQMLKYHHRLIVLLKPKHALQWLSGGKSDPEEKFNFLLEHRYTPEFKVARDRKMASGWKPRVAKHLSDLESEQAYREELGKMKLRA